MKSFKKSLVLNALTLGVSLFPIFGNAQANGVVTVTTTIDMSRVSDPFLMTTLSGNMVALEDDAKRICTKAGYSKTIFKVQYRAAKRGMTAFGDYESGATVFCQGKILNSTTE